MQNSQIVHFEAHSMLSVDRDRAISMFSGGRHEVVDYAYDMRTAMSLLNSMAAGTILANTVMFGPDLSPDLSPGTVPGRGALKISDKIHKLGLHVRKIGIYTHSVSDLGVPVDAYVQKDCTVSELLTVLDNLKEPRTKKKHRT